jgi:monoamine oxidase
LVLWERAVGSVAARLSQAERDDLYQDRPAFLGTHALDEESLHGRLLAAGLSEGAVQLFASTWNLETSIHFALCEHLREEIEGVWAGTFDEIEDGMDRLPAAAASKLKTPVAYGSPVVAIDQDGSGVTAVINGPDGRRVVTADWMICTAPLGVLARIDYARGWSTRKADAMRRVNYDDSTKVLALTRSRFWELDDGIYGGGSVSDGVLGSTWYPADNADARSDEVSRAPAVLLASYSWGQTARRMARDRSGTSVLPALAQLHDRIAADRSQVEKLVPWAWGEHPWSAGAYAFYNPGDQTGLHDALVAPEGRILLAGEHASLHHSWIQGAIQSGLNAAARIVDTETGR